MGKLDRLIRWFQFNWLYLGSPRWDTGISPPELLSLLRQREPGRALDLGCGTGTNLVTLAQAGWQVTGVDFAARAVLEARRKLRRANVVGDVRVGDVVRLETVRGQYDLVLDIGCYHSLSAADRAAYRSNLTQILVPGGDFLLYAHWQKDGPIGIQPSDLVALEAALPLVSRQDSLDRFERRATWLHFQRQKDA